MYACIHEGEPPTGDFHPHTHAHAGRTPRRPADCLQRPLRSRFQPQLTPGVEPDALEKTFADLESQAAEVLRQIHLKKQLPEDDDDFNILLNFVSFMMVRVPAFRDVHHQNMERYYEILMRVALHSREAWQKTVEGIKTDGSDISSEVTYEQMKEFIGEKRYTVEIHRHWHLKTLLEMHDSILPLLGQREWSLLIANPNVGYFVTSDRPVLLNWTEEMPAFFSPGLGLLNTEVRMPLTKEVCLVGRFADAPLVITADLMVIAAVNSGVLMQADRRVFSASNCQVP